MLILLVLAVGYLVIAAACTRTSAEVRYQSFVTGYSWYDNTPPSSATVCCPVRHQEASGVGTYADPITMAVGHTIVDGQSILDFPAGTRFYIPNLRRYFIVEDTCGDGPTPQSGPCHTGYPSDAQNWLDVWIDGRNGTVASTDACTDAFTGVHLAIKDPEPDYAVVSGPIYGPTGCTAQYGDTTVMA